MYHWRIEYACEMWDNIGVVYSYKLENAQLKIVNIEAGLQKRDSTGQEKSKSRREKKNNFNDVYTEL